MRATKTNQTTENNDTECILCGRIGDCSHYPFGTNDAVCEHCYQAEIVEQSVPYGEDEEVSR